MKRIPLTQNKFALVDDNDFEWLMKYKWQYSSKGYARHSKYLGKKWGKHKRTSIIMHRLILNTPNGMDTDHINGDRLDNRRSNLRIATRSQNQYNKLGANNASSKFKGVSISSGGKKWRAYIDKPQIHLGTFNSEIDAALAYNNKAIELYGEFALLNKT